MEFQQIPINDLTDKNEKQEGETRYQEFDRERKEE